MVRFVLFIMVLIVLFFVRIPSLHAATFSNASITLDSLSAQTTLSGRICATPVSSGVEGSISITFPQTFSLDSSTTNWDLSTTSLPAGTTAWPGIGAHPQSISGNTITVTSSDLVSGNPYCFRFSSSSSSTGTAGNDLNGTITTYTSGSTILDRSTYALSIGGSPLTVSATVPATPTDFSVSLAANKASLTQDEEVTYTITYQSLLASSAQVTITASWDKATLTGDALPSIGVVDYMNGSATKAYNNTIPIIDTVNRTITWNIASLPAQSGPYTASFTLRGNSTYTGTTNASFSTYATLSGVGTSTPTQNISTTFIPQPASSPTPTITSTSSPVSIASPTPTPTRHSSVSIESVTIAEITPTSVTLVITVSVPGQVTIYYGTKIAQSSLSRSVKLIRKTQTVFLDNLQKDIPYYFFVKTPSDTSDTFTFRTAKEASQVTIREDTVAFLSQDKVIAQTKPGERITEKVVVFPKEAPFTFTIQLHASESARIVAHLEPLQVLGAMYPPAPLPKTNEVELVEISPSIYQARIAAPTSPGLYALMLTIFDTKGNITEKKLTTIRISEQFQVKDKTTNQGIEHAKVTLYKYNHQTHIYQILPSISLGIDNPGFTNAKGEFGIVLPPGQYKAEVSAYGYTTESQEFTLGEAETQDYPRVLLQPKQVTVLEFIGYYGGTITEGSKNLLTLFRDSLESKRFLDLFSITAMLVAIVLSYWGLLERFGMPFSLVPTHLRHILFFFVKEPSATNLFQGEVTDSYEHTPLSNAYIYIIHAATNAIVGHTRTTQKGIFTYGKKLPAEFQLYVTHPDYEPFTSDILTGSLVVHNKPTILLSRTARQHSISAYAYKALSYLVREFFEFTLFATLLTEILLVQVYGIQRIFVLLVISGTALIIWIFHHVRTETPQG